MTTNSMEEADKLGDRIGQRPARNLHERWACARMGARGRGLHAVLPGRDRIRSFWPQRCAAARQAACVRVVYLPQSEVIHPAAVPPFTLRPPLGPPRALWAANSTSRRFRSPSLSELVCVPSMPNPSFCTNPCDQSGLPLPPDSSARCRRVRCLPAATMCRCRSFGVGYMLTLSKAPAGFAREKVSALVHAHVPEAQVRSAPRCATESRAAAPRRVTSAAACVAHGVRGGLAPHIVGRAVRAARRVVCSLCYTARRTSSSGSARHRPRRSPRCSRRWTRGSASWACCTTG
jgi:hypothetical protein